MLSSFPRPFAFVAILIDSGLQSLPAQMSSSLKDIPPGSQQAICEPHIEPQPCPAVGPISIDSTVAPLVHPSQTGFTSHWSGREGMVRQGR